MNEETFRKKIAPEIVDRWNGKFTEAMMSDWNYFMHAFTVDESLEHIRSFFRQYEQRGNPRPSEFGSWLKKNQIHTMKKDKVKRFNIEALDWPGKNGCHVTMFRMVDDRRGESVIRFGWIERKPHTERGYVWIRHDDYWYLECFTPDLIRYASVSLRAMDEAPNSWTKTSYSKNPERIEELLSKEYF